MYPEGSGGNNRFLEKADKVINKCIRYLTKYERYVLMSIRQDFSAWTVRKLLGRSHSYYYRVKELLKKYVLYKYLLEENKKLIYDFMIKVLGRKAFRDRFYPLILNFPIRSSYWYDKYFKYSKGYTYRKVKRMLKKVDKLLGEMDESYEKEIYNLFIESFKNLVFKGGYCVRKKVKEDSQ